MMKRILICILIWFLGSFVVYGQQKNVTFELLADGETFGFADGLDETQITWSITNLRTTCTVMDSEFGFGMVLHTSEYQVIFTDLQALADKVGCGGWILGDDIRVDVSVHSSGHKYNGYSGSRIYKITDPNGENFLGSLGINLTGMSKIGMDIDLLGVWWRATENIIQFNNCYNYH